MLDKDEVVKDIMDVASNVYDVLLEKNKRMKDIDKQSFIVGFTNAMMLSRELEKEENNSTKKEKKNESAQEC